MYVNVLGRVADENGLEFWVNQLENGVQRNVVLINFSESEENRQKSEPQQKIVLVYGALIGRDPSEDEYNSSSSLPLEEVINNLLFSPFYIGPTVP